MRTIPSLGNDSTRAPYLSSPTKIFPTDGSELIHTVDSEHEALVAPTTMNNGTAENTFLRNLHNANGGNNSSSCGSANDDPRLLSTGRRIATMVVGEKTRHNHDGKFLSAPLPSSTSCTTTVTLAAKTNYLPKSLTTYTPRTQTATKSNASRSRSTRNKTKSTAVITAGVQLAVVAAIAAARLVPVGCVGAGGGGAGGGSNEWQHPHSRPRQRIPWTADPATASDEHRRSGRGGRRGGGEVGEGEAAVEGGWSERKRSDSMREIIEVGVLLYRELGAFST